MTATFRSLPPEIILEIAETDPKIFSTMRFLSKEFKLYTDKHIEKYKEKFSEETKDCITVTHRPPSMKMIIYDNDDRIISKHWVDYHTNESKFDISVRTLTNKRFKILTLSGSDDVYRISYFDNIKHGSYIYSGGSRRIECNFNMGSLHGSYKEWFKDHLYKSFEYDNCELSGECSQWYKIKDSENQPSLRYKCTYLKNKINGSFKEWKNGVLIQDIFCNNGIVEKSQISYDDGNIKSISYYRKQKLHGTIYFRERIKGLFGVYRVDKDIIRQATFEAGEIHGIYSVKRYGVPIRKYLYQHGKLIKRLGIRGENNKNSIPSENFYEPEDGCLPLCSKLLVKNSIQHKFRVNGFEELRRKDNEMHLLRSNILNDPEPYLFHAGVTGVYSLATRGGFGFDTRDGSMFDGPGGIFLMPNAPESIILHPWHYGVSFWIVVHKNKFKDSELKITMRHTMTGRLLMQNKIYTDRKTLSHKKYSKQLVNNRKQRQIKQCNRRN